MYAWLRYCFGFNHRNDPLSQTSKRSYKNLIDLCSVQVNLQSCYVRNQCFMKYFAFRRYPHKFVHSTGKL